MSVTRFIFCIIYLLGRWVTSEKQYKLQFEISLSKRCGTKLHCCNNSSIGSWCQLQAKYVQLFRIQNECTTFSLPIHIVFLTKTARKQKTMIRHCFYRQTNVGYWGIKKVNPFTEYKHYQLLGRPAYHMTLLIAWILYHSCSHEVHQFC
jgi:hypothetical protein